MSPQPEGLENRALLSTSAALDADDIAIDPKTGAAFVSDELLVRFKPGTAAEARANARGQSNGALAETIHTKPMQAAGQGVLERVTLPAGLPIEAAIRVFEANPNVEHAERNWVYTTDATSEANDLYYENGSLWGMYGDSTTPSNPNGSQAGEAWAAGATGSEDIYVGVIDTGIQFSHSDLDGNVGTNPGETAGDGIDNDLNGYVDDIHGWDFFSNDNSIYDNKKHDEHGTHVTGTIGAEGNNQDGVAGVNWNVNVLSGKFLGPRGGTTADAIKAVDYFTELSKSGVNVVATNNSWGGGGPSTELYDAISRANEQGILFIAAAGNNSSNNDVLASYPASYDLPNIISVASINSAGGLSYFSNYGETTVDLGAPGSNIVSTLPENTYGSFSGTSMATPHVTGAAALYASEYLKANGALPSASNIKDAILSTVVPTPSLNGYTVTGGRLNVAAALNDTPVTSAPAAPTNLSATVDSSNPTSQINLTWTDNSDNEAGFEIWRSTDGTNFEYITTTDANVTNYQATGLASDTTYDFQVRATNAAGQSEFSNTASARTEAVVTASLFSDNFDSGYKSNWSFYSGTWDSSNGMLHQTDTSDGDLKKAMVHLDNPGDQATEITAKVRIDSWEDGEYARAGVSLLTDSSTGKGYSFLVTGRHNTGSPNRLEFLYDGVAWSGWPTVAGSNGVAEFNMQVGETYWFKMKFEAGVLYGKVWPVPADGSTSNEPAEWNLTFDAAGHGWNRTTGLAGLNGGAAGKFQPGGKGKPIFSSSTASFDNVTLIGTTTSGTGSTTTLAADLDGAVPARSTAVAGSGLWFLPDATSPSTPPIASRQQAADRHDAWTSWDSESLLDDVAIERLRSGLVPTA